MTKRFKELIVSMQENSMQQQREILNDFLANWKGETDQTDDVLVIGIRKGT
jgi:hypothetical protein